MPIKVYKVADIIDAEVVFSASAGKQDPAGSLDKFDTLEARADSTIFAIYPPADVHDRLAPNRNYSNLSRYLSTSSYSGAEPVFLP
jgi:hypothetical protein